MAKKVAIGLTTIGVIVTSIIPIVEKIIEQVK